MTGDGRLVEVQATAETRPVRPGAARRACSTSPRRASRSSRCSQREAIALAARGRVAAPVKCARGSRSQNPHKLEELRAALPDWEIEPLDADDWPPEEGADLRGERARQGALRRGLAACAPGCSARTPASSAPRSTVGPASTPPAGLRRRPGGGAAERLAGETTGGRGCHELVASPPTASELAGTGVLEGRSRASRAASGGFGYDPIFVPDGRRPDGRGARRRLEAEHSHRAGPRRRSRGSSSEPAAPGAGCQVDLGPEDDHVRHHVEPDEQHRRARRAPAAPGCAWRRARRPGSTWNVASSVTAAATAPGQHLAPGRSTFVST